MKFRLRLLGAASLAMLTLGNALADDVKVIANPSVKTDTISAGELRRVFLGEKISLADGTHVEPVLQKGGPVHAGFLRDYLGMNEDDLETYYRTLLFTGKGSMPRAFGSDAEVLAYVARTRGAIGYVSDTFPGQGVKTLSIGISKNNAERKLIMRVEPDYPETLKLLNIGGTVRLRISISSRGSVEQVDLLGGNPILAESATTAVRKWVYAAGPSRTVADISLSFGSH